MHAQEPELLGLGEHTGGRGGQPGEDFSARAAHGGGTGHLHVRGAVGRVSRRHVGGRRLEAGLLRDRRAARWRQLARLVDARGRRGVYPLGTSYILLYPGFSEEERELGFL